MDRDPNEASNAAFLLSAAIDRDASREPRRSVSRLTAAERARYEAAGAARREDLAASGRCAS